MGMQDTPRHLHGEAAAAVLVEAFQIAPASADAALRTAVSELAWHLERNTLSRGGLADLVQALGSGHHTQSLGGSDLAHDAAVHADGNAILRHILGTEDRSRALAARICRATQLGEPAVASMLPVLAVLVMARLAAGASKGVGEVLAVMPPLGRWSRGSAHADLADILRRGCGGGPYAPARLRRAVRGAIAGPAGFVARGALRWYAHFLLLRPLSGPVRAVLARTSSTR
jgi:hypothetical protein